MSHHAVPKYTIPEITVPKICHNDFMNQSVAVQWELWIYLGKKAMTRGDFSCSVPVHRTLLEAGFSYNDLTSNRPRMTGLGPCLYIHTP